MRTLSKENQEHLKKNEVYQFIINHPKPDFTELDKECDDFENWLLMIYELPRQSVLTKNMQS